MALRLATDIGGTFTDLVLVDEADGEVVVAKVPTTPQQFEQGVLHAIDRAELQPHARITDFVHGSTVVINALIERTGSPTALITTRGFRDVLEMGRSNRPALFDLRYEKPRPFVERRFRFEVNERLDHNGQVITPLDEEEVLRIADHLLELQIESVAICFLHSYANPVHERRCRDLLIDALPDAAITSSHEITLEWREYERTTSAVLNAYVMPTTARYLDALSSSLDVRLLVDRGRFIMQSNGGIMSFRRAVQAPITTVESGPVGGVLGSAVLGRAIGRPNVISLDIGGTTAKTSLIQDGEVRVTTEYQIGWRPDFPGYPIKSPVVDIVEIGAGGGSIAWFDNRGSLRVGPRSAGAAPGPACYPDGGAEPTVTDANLVAGRIDPSFFLGGEIPVSVERARRAIQGIASRLGTSIEEAALGIIRIANANMVNAVRLVSVRRGYDPRAFAIVAFGGGGSMHATALAAQLRIRTVIVPYAAATFSAWGMLMTDLRADWVQTRILSLTDAVITEVDATYEALEDEATRYCAAEGLDYSDIRLTRFADVRYKGQEHTVKVSVPTHATVSELLDSFHALHQQRYTFRLDAPAEIVNFHLIAFGMLSEPTLSQLHLAARDTSPKPISNRPVDFDELGRHDANIFQRASLPIEQVIRGPAVIEDRAASTVLFPEQSARLDKWGNLIIELDE